MTELKIAPVGIDAARFAVTHWHYSGSMPSGKTIKVGAWEDGRYIGCVIVSRGATPVLGSPYGLGQAECVELTRVALDRHVTPVSQIVAAALRYVKAHNPGLRLVVSFADPAQGHHGGIYQAGNWIYAGTSAAKQYIRVNGEVVHPRTLGKRYGVGGQSIPWLRANVDPNVSLVDQPRKHRYLMPLDRAMRRQVAPLAKPYPGRAVEASNGDAPGYHPGEAGSIPVDRSTDGR